MLRPNSITADERLNEPSVDTYILSVTAKPYFFLLRCVYLFGFHLSIDFLRGRLLRFCCLPNKESNDIYAMIFT